MLFLAQIKAKKQIAHNELEMKVFAARKELHQERGGRFLLASSLLKANGLGLIAILSFRI